MPLWLWQVFGWIFLGAEYQQDFMFSNVTIQHEMGLVIANSCLFTSLSFLIGWDQVITGWNYVYDKQH